MKKEKNGEKKRKKEKKKRKKKMITFENDLSDRLMASNQSTWVTQRGAGR